MSSYDKQLAFLVARLRLRAQARPARPRRTVQPGLNALQRLSTGALVAETYRRLGQWEGRVPEREQATIKREYERRGLDTCAQAFAGAVVVSALPASAAFASLADSNLSDATLEKSLPGEVEAISRNIDGFAEAESRVLQQPMASEEFLEDLQESGVSLEALDSFSFVAQYTPENISSALVEQRALEATGSTELESQADLTNEQTSVGLDL